MDLIYLNNFSHGIEQDLYNIKQTLREERGHIVFFLALIATNVISLHKDNRFFFYYYHPLSA